MWVPISVALFLLPSLILWWMLRQARKAENTKTISVSSARDQQEQCLTYLFALLVPLFDGNTDGMREPTAVSLAFIFVMFFLGQRQGWKPPHTRDQLLASIRENAARTVRSDCRR